MKIWKMGYFPFTMGGNLYRPIATEFPDEKLGISYDLGLGFEGYLIADSRNRTFVVENLWLRLLFFRHDYSLSLASLVV